MSDTPDSWPIGGWPGPDYSLLCTGEWFGRTGCGKMNADLETYFVVNDAQDQEYLQNKWVYSGNNIPESCLGPYTNLDSCNVYCDSSCVPTEPFEYYPRPGKFIQESSSVQAGLPWGGIGIRVAVRGYQWDDYEWDNAIARDMIFWEYEVTNISDYDITEVSFGFWFDHAIGGDEDEYSYYDSDFDFSYSWDEDGIGFGGVTPGIMGLALLETPGVANDGIDNDDDGLLDEERNNEAGSLIGPTDGIYDLEKFLDFYDLEESDLKEHFEGDEDQDWVDGNDINGNGIYEPELGEYSGDDIGLDGIGPEDVNYLGPDEGECNHMPDYVDGVGCEPNFAITDVTESDMIGLTTFQSFPIHVGSHNDPNFPWFKNDHVMWDLLNSGIIQYMSSPSNLVLVLGTGPFQLNKGISNKVAFAELHSFDYLIGQPPPSTAPQELIQKKLAAQKIVENDYKLWDNDDSMAINETLPLPKHFVLHQNYPNPFNPITTLRYNLPEQAQVILTIYNLMGREITKLVNTTQDAGFRSVQWNATDMRGKPVSAGVYLYQIRAGEFVQTRKMVLLK
jgi:hypothetical protein